MDSALSQPGPADGARRGRGFSLRTLIVLRWLTILGQSAAILTASQGLHFPLPLWPCLIVIAVSAAVNVGAMARVRRLEASLPDGRTTALHLGFDIFQLSLLLGLTGGLENPFCLLLVAPVIGAYPLPALALAALSGVAGDLGSDFDISDHAGIGVEGRV